MKIVEAVASDQNIQISADMDGIPATIKGDERKIKQVMYNLLSNAVKFTQNGGIVRIGAKTVDRPVRTGLRKDDSEDTKIVQDSEEAKIPDRMTHAKCIEISVSDTGIGIKPEDCERIFNRFEQADGSSVKKYPGTGLGLPLARAFVELHGGKIWVESQGDGQGSTFYFIIPI
jgi:signal transduction histidine kinase